MNGLAAQGKWTPDLEKQKDLVLSG
jgi:hypothetical protein